MGRGVSKLRVAGVRVLLSTLLSESLQIFTDLESLIERLKACKGCVLTFFCHLYSLLSVCNLQIGKKYLYFKRFFAWQRGQEGTCRFHPCTKSNEIANMTDLFRSAAVHWAFVVAAALAASRIAFEWLYRGLKISIGFWGLFYYNYHKEPQNSIGNY